VAHGESLHRELELLVEAGMSTVDVLRATASLPARYFGLSDRGLLSRDEGGFGAAMGGSA
jgi:hypothetical protein